MQRLYKTVVQFGYSTFVAPGFGNALPGIASADETQLESTEASGAL